MEAGETREPLCGIVVLIRNLISCRPFAISTNPNLPLRRRRPVEWHGDPARGNDEARRAAGRADFGVGHAVSFLAVQFRDRVGGDGGVYDTLGGHSFSGAGDESSENIDGGS